MKSQWDKWKQIKERQGYNVQQQDFIKVMYALHRFQC